MRPQRRLFQRLFFAAFSTSTIDEFAVQGNYKDMEQQCNKDLKIFWNAFRCTQCDPYNPQYISALQESVQNSSIHEAQFLKLVLNYGQYLHTYLDYVKQVGADKIDPRHLLQVLQLIAEKQDSLRDVSTRLLMKAPEDMEHAEFLMDAIKKNSQTDRATLSQAHAMFAIMNMQKQNREVAITNVDLALKTYNKNMDAQLLKAYMQKEEKERLRLVDEAIAMNPACADAYLVKSTIQLQNMTHTYLLEEKTQKSMSTMEQTLYQGWQNCTRPLSKARIQDRMIMVALRYARFDSFALNVDAHRSTVPDKSKMLISFANAALVGLKVDEKFTNFVYSSIVPIYWSLKRFQELDMSLPNDKELAAKMAMAYYIFCTPYFYSSNSLFAKASMFFKLPSHITSASLSKLHYALLVMQGGVNMQELVQCKSEKQVVAYLEQQFKNLDKDKHTVFQQDYDVSELCHAKLIEKLGFYLKH